MQRQVPWWFLPAVLVVCGATACDTVTSPGDHELSVAGYGASAAGPGEVTHYDLVLVGVPGHRTRAMDREESTPRVFVKLPESTGIHLSEGDFGVRDPDATALDGVTLQLPNPDPDGDGVTAYSVFVRALAPRSGEATLQSCYRDESGEWCAANFIDGVRPIEVRATDSAAPPTDVWRELLFVDVCRTWVAEAGVQTCLDAGTMALFSGETLGYLWEYVGNGLKRARLRFSEVPSRAPWGAGYPTPIRPYYAVPPGGRSSR